MLLRSVYAFASLFFAWTSSPALGSDAHQPTAFSHATSTVQTSRTGASGQPLPRFVAIKVKVANMRTGPSTDYPIALVYKRPGLPLKVVDEKGPWRLVVDQDGDEGWMHTRLLTGRRTALLLGKPGARRTLFAKAGRTSSVRLTAEPGVTGNLNSCGRVWCQLEVDGTKAWIERRHLWGILPGEMID